MLIRIKDTTLSLAKVIIKSRFFLKKYRTPHSSVIIIGNGPSAKAMLENPPAVMGKVPLMAVNMFAGEKYFTALKPAYFLMADHAFYEFDGLAFEQPAKHPKVASNEGYLQTQQLVNKTWHALLNADWDITLFVPQIYMKTWPVKQAVSKGMKVVTWNYTVVRGFHWFENLLYSTGLGSPQCQNVINACIFQSINSGFKRVYLTGIDNNFHLNILVDNNNTVCIADNHFYEVEKKITPLMTPDGKGGSVPVRLHEFFRSLGKAFYAYHRLRQYADRKLVQVYNCSPGSFVDAFDRITLDGINDAE